jgi:hypothetical protein
MPRRKPYTTRGIRRVPCFRCGRPGRFQWQICADSRVFRAVCDRCDIALNRLVLRWMRFANWHELLQRYKQQVADV